MIGLTGVEKNTVKAETQTIDTTSEEFKQGFLEKYMSMLR